MLFTTFLNYATKRLRAGAIVALNTVSITLLSACADGNDIAAAEDTSWTSISAAEETVHASGLRRAGGTTPGTAQAMFDELEVKGLGPKTEYDADFFTWRSDADQNGCDGGRVGCEKTHSPVNLTIVRQFRFQQITNRIMIGGCGCD